MRLIDADATKKAYCDRCQLEPEKCGGDCWVIRFLDSMPECGTVLSDNSINILLICSLRYALGRCTYVTSEIPAIFYENADKLTINTINAAISDIEDRVRLYNIGEKKALGDECDRVSWMELLKWLKTMKGLKEAEGC